MQARQRKLTVVVAAVVPLLIALAVPSTAQSGGGPPPGGHWQITYRKEGQMTDAWTDIGGSQHTGSAAIGPSTSSLAPQGTYTQGCGTSGSMNLTVNVTVILQWVDYYGQPTTVGVPNKVNLKLISQGGRYAAGDNYGEGSGSGTTDNGQGDPDVVTASDAHGSSSESAGAHLIQRYGSSGHFEIPITITAHAQATGKYSCGVSCNYGLSAAIDPREVTIDHVAGTDSGATYHKGADGSRVLNEHDANGTMYGDTAVPFPFGCNLAYRAYAINGWASNSEYHWYSSRTGYWAAGTFDPLIPDLNPFYPAATTSGQDHIFIHLIDSADGANGTANYYMRFHQDIENFITLTDQNQQGTAVRVSPVYHDQGGSISMQISSGVSVTQTATGELSLTESQIAAKFSFQLGQTYTSQYNYTVTHNLVASMYCWIQRTPFWRHRAGTADSYGADGYQGLLHWTADTAYTPQNPLIDYTEDLKMSPTPPGY